MKNICLIKVFVTITISLVLIFSFSTSVFADENKGYSAKDGVVEIYSGISDMNEHFYKIKNCSGFIVSNSENGCYIVTASNGVTISSKERKKCLKKNKLSNESFGYNDTIKVIINGDVATTLTTVATSKNENFSILRAENVINEKTPLKLGNSVNKGDYVYSLGFVNTSANLYMQYDEDDVMSFTGNVTNPKVSLKNNTYIEHTANFDQDCLGGPLVNEKGYVIGLNCIYNSDGEYFSLGIDTIKNILDNYSITYSSLNYDNSYLEYTKLYDECNSLCNSEDYTDESIEEMKTVLEEVELSMGENQSVDDVKFAIQKLSEVKSQMVKKTSTLNKAIYVLSGMLTALVFWLICILIRLRKHTHPKKDKVKNPNYKEEKEENIESTEELITIPNVRHSCRIAYLKSIDSQVKIKIEKNRFTMGSDADEVDFSVNNRAVSRKHATIELIDDKFVIFDNNSVNGTYVNDVFVESIGKELKNGDLVALANEQFIFEEKTIVGGGI